MHPQKAEIYNALQKMKEENCEAQRNLKKEATLTDYRSLARADDQDGEPILVWTNAFQTALSENEIIHIPASDEPYYIDSSIIVPSNRRIEAEDGAVIKLKKGVKTLMLRNEHTQDGTHAPISCENRDFNIAIVGGCWDESKTCRSDYGQTGRYDEERSFFGVTCGMFFNNLTGLTIENVTFKHTGVFAVEMGDIKNVYACDIVFYQCFADGFHLNGNSEKVWFKNVSGECGDDIVALNAYDWQVSSVNFGPSRNILCENINPSALCPCRSIRILQGKYSYDDGSVVNCGIFGLIMKNVSGIRSFKMYYQTPPYRIGKGYPEKGDVGDGDWHFFEDIEFDMNAPMDLFPQFLGSDPVKGAFAAFEVGANIGHMFFENIDLKMYREKFPFSYLLCVGPRSVTVEDGNLELFDPYVSCSVGTVCTKNIRINGVET